MINLRLTAKDRGLIKGALRRAFARSELHRKIIDRTRVSHYDDTRPRVKKWSRCENDQQLVPTYTLVVDHIDPVIPLHLSFELMELTEVVDRMWCDEINLQAICNSCHDIKSREEREKRKLLGPKRGKKK